MLGKAEATAALVRINRHQRILDAGGVLTPRERAQVWRDVALLAEYVGEDPQRSMEIGDALL